MTTEFTPVSWGAFDASGKLRAIFDSEPEAYFYVNGRGHMHGGTMQKMGVNAASAPSLLAALQGVVTCLEAHIDSEVRRSDIARTSEECCPCSSGELKRARAAIAAATGEVQP